MHVNKVHHVKTISRAAKELGEDEDWLFKIAIGMEVEDGATWVYDTSEDGEMAFTDFGSVKEYVDLMNNLKLPNPKMMDVAVPANMRVGLHQDEIARKGWAISAAEAVALHGRPEIAIIDLREKSERERHGTIPGSLHAPYPDLQENISDGGMLHELAEATGKRIVFYCAFGERSAMAVQAAQDAGLKTACHIQGGIDAWKKANGPLAR